MPDTVANRIVAIHSMLSAGHRNLRVERHTLILWGLAGGGLLTLSPYILTEADVPALEERALAWLGLIAGVLGAVGVIDWRLTRRAKRVRDEAWSFIHRQILKVWWLLMGLGALLTFATFFFGGGYMVCAAWMILIGLGLYVHGLFSEELLEWVGALAIIIGVASLGYRLGYDDMRLIAASMMGLGLPALAAMLDHGRNRPAWRRALQSALWLALVLGVPIVVKTGSAPATEAAAVVSLEAFRKTPPMGVAVVALPAGTPVPVDIAITGQMFRNGPVSLPLTLAVPVEAMTRDGQPTGAVRIGDGPWTTAAETLWLRIPSLKAVLAPGSGPGVAAVLSIEPQSSSRR